MSEWMARFTAWSAGLFSRAGGGASVQAAGDGGLPVNLGSYDYAHPVFDQAAVAAQGRMHLLQGQHGRYYCGAWMGYGFHEDGLKAGLAAAKKLLADVAAEGVQA